MGRHTLAVWTNNQAGVLQRIAGLFSRRGYNIESITVGPSEPENLARMTIVAVGDHNIREQLIVQLRKQIDVIKVIPLADSAKISRELMLIKLRGGPAQKQAIVAVLKPFQGSIIDVG